MFLPFVSLSAIAYMALVVLTARLVFAMQIVSGNLPKKARTIGIGLVLSLLPGVLGAHFTTLFFHLSSLIWAVTLAGMLCIILPIAGIWPRQQTNKIYDDDPF